LSADGDRRDLSYFLRRLRDIEGLARIEDDWVKNGMLSTYNRSGGNSDGFTFWTLDGEERMMARRLPGPGLHYHSDLAVGDRAVVADLEGPGCIDRMFVATPGGRLRFYLDGQDQPTIEATCEDLFEGRLDAFPSPITGQRGRSYYSFMPVPFRSRCRIEVEAIEPSGRTLDLGYGNYYQVNYRQFSPDVDVVSHPGTLSAAEQSDVEAVRRQWLAVGQDPRSDVEYEWFEGAATIESGKTVTLLDTAGAGSIGQLWIIPEDPSTDTRDFLRRTALRCYWDQARFPSVDVPLGDFFGYGLGMRYPVTQDSEPGPTYTSLAFQPLRLAGPEDYSDKKLDFSALMMGMTDEGYYSYWPMPFSDGARVELKALTASTPRSIPVRYRIAVRRATPDASTGRFHAEWRQSISDAVPDPNPTDENNVLLLERHGRGHYVGCNLNVFTLAGGWWGEGDPMFMIDDDTWPPSYHGTGEYFNDGWGFAAGHCPVSGCIIAGWNESDFFGPTAVYTHHLGDRVQFRHRIRASIEAWPAAFRYRHNYYSSTVYWYQQGPLQPVQSLPFNRIPTLRFTIDV
jgi:hypothetical protein